jgi:hypothetical protein
VGVSGFSELNNVVVTVHAMAGLGMIAIAGLAAGGGGVASHWDLSTDDTRIQITVADNRPLVRILEDTADKHNWAGDGFAVELMSKVRVGESEVATRWVFDRGVVNRRAGTLTLAFINEQP